MGGIMLKAALFYHNEGLCVIPVRPREKAPALITWEEYQTRRSTEAEVRGWFTNGPGYNIGIVHGEVSGNFVSLDFDHDNGLWSAAEQRLPELFVGRLEQSGSLEGYHIPLRVEDLPDFGYNERQERPRGNKTWKTKLGDCNIRARYCQTLAPPSIHPSGNLYRFKRKRPLVKIENLDNLIDWLNDLAPPPPPKRVKVRGRSTGTSTVGDGSLIDAVKDAWPDALSVFQQFGMATRMCEERNGELRLRGNGGLLIHANDPCRWFNFSDEIGGDQITAWGWCRYGSAYNPGRQFRVVIVEMAQVAGVDVAQFYRRGDEEITATVQNGGNREYWSKQYEGRWKRMR